MAADPIQAPGSDGFLAEDYQGLFNDMSASLVIRDEATLRAIMSNSVDMILGALRDAVSCREVCDDILLIMETYHEQDAKGFVDTPGGLEHMGDVWNQLLEWESTLKTNKT